MQSSKLIRRGLLLIPLFLSIFFSTQVQAARTIVWNGDKIGTIANGWSGPSNSSKVQASPGTGVDGSVGLSWRFEGEGWSGIGWNWYSWWPSDAGTDITDFTYLVFKIKITIPPKGKVPSSDTLTVGLTSSGNPGKSSDQVRIAAYCPEAFDGSWHEVFVPVKDLMVSEKAKLFNPSSVWQFDSGCYTPDKRNYTVYFDDIGFDTVKPDTPKK